MADNTHKLIKNACTELDKIAETGLNRTNIENAYKLAIIKEKLLRAEELMQGDDGYSQRGYSNARYSRRSSYADSMDSGYSGGRYSRDADASYDDGDVSAARGQHYVRGHYSRDSYANDGSYSNASGRMENCKAEMMEALEMIERNADSQDRKKIQEYKHMIETMEV